MQPERSAPCKLSFDALWRWEGGGWGFGGGGMGLMLRASPWHRDWLVGVYQGIAPPNHLEKIKLHE